ncbi:DTW domain-containing protein 1-like [Centruroides sculpturatus]|uniref:DTW domain-containing protein 1-like n=1 Tax=Centruroides sculpturatus TaxID=218467 RepID=UPI000C6E0938|nr:DTW domain-containing protein 1-like [Centruroides sculpturatus]XP_023229169.1 DTW domain-containing protein 1-like [Centruroides sculpturatus]
MASVQKEKPKRKYLIESSCLFTNRESADPLSKFSINSCDFLEELPERSACPRCYKSRRYYCYNCYVPVDEIKEKIPYLKLPVKIDIIKHPREVDGKSTSAHAAILAPDDVKVYVYPEFPDYAKEKVILIFPGKNAMHLSDYFEENMSKFDQGNLECDKNKLFHNNLPPNSCRKTSNTQEITNCQNMQRNQFNHNLPFDKVVFIDSTWKQTKQIYSNECIRSLPCIMLTSHRSLFWRHQRNKPPNYLSTIEAIYYFLVELHRKVHPDVAYRGEYDNLLFFFKYMYNKIRTLYDPKKLRAYQD